MKQIIVLCLIIYLCSAEVAHKQFLSFMSEHGKEYENDEEFVKRFHIFRENLKLIEEMNRNSTGAVFGVTSFTDLTPQEFKNLYLMNYQSRNMTGETYMDVPRISAPTSFDWRSKGAVSSVKNEGQCGSCWAFSATENIESVYQIGGQGLPIIAPQQMVDCEKDCYGCGGGWPYKAFNYVVKAGGQDTEASYPYTARDGSCKFKPGSVGAKIKGYKNIPRDEHQLQTALTTTSPFSICVDASRWQNYRGGVMTSSQCGRGIDHCVQLVGYDASKNTPYWIVRNSWGTGWGVSGYIYLEMWKDTCAMAEDVTTATL